MHWKFINFEDCFFTLLYRSCCILNQTNLIVNPINIMLDRVHILLSFRDFPFDLFHTFLISFNFSINLRYLMNFRLFFRLNFRRFLILLRRYNSLTYCNKIPSLIFRLKEWMKLIFTAFFVKVLIFTLFLDLDDYLPNIVQVSKFLNESFYYY